MPNFKTHLAVGLVTGAAVGLGLQLLSRNSQEGRVTPVNWGIVGFSAVLGAGAAILPDILEPATSPNHRRFFHSICMGGLILFALLKYVPRCLSALIFWALGLGYLSHLVADFRTRRCLPWI